MLKNRMESNKTETERKPEVELGDCILNRKVREGLSRDVKLEQKVTRELATLLSGDKVVGIISAKT